MSVAIRLAVASDAPALAALYAPYVLHTGVTFETVPPTAAEFAQRIRETQAFFPYYVLEEDGQIVGYAYAHFLKERKAYQWLAEPSIYIRQDKHRRGYARLLYEKLLKSLKMQGFCEVVAVLGCPNEPSERLHEALGFHLSAELPQAGYKLGRWYDVKYYSLEINPRCENPREPVPFSSLNCE